MHALLHLLGVDDLTGAWYGFWSGIAGDLSILAAPLVLLRKHNCHVRGCPRLGRHQVDGTTWLVCRRHHPDDHPTASAVAAAADRQTEDER